MIKVNMPIIVEGKYDKIKLQSVVDATIITTDGFRIYKDKEKLSLIRAYADKTGVIILTDSDGAGFQIRNHLKSVLGNGKIINVYIPDIFGKEKRKSEPSKEGKLGVEGIDIKTLEEAFIKAGVLSETKKNEPFITKADLLEDGLIGESNSSSMRKELCRKLKLPERLSTSALIESLNNLYTKAEYESALTEIRKSNGEN